MVLFEFMYKQQPKVSQHDTTGCRALREFAKDEASLPPYRGVPVGKDCDGHDHVYVQVEDEDRDEWADRIVEMIKDETASEALISAIATENVNILEILNVGGRVAYNQEEE